MQSKVNDCLSLNYCLLDLFMPCHQIQISMIDFVASDCSNEEIPKSEMLPAKINCKNYTTRQPTIVVGDSQGMLANHIWSYVFRLAVKVR